ncbi:hypothetical protein HNQ86_001230 [Oleiagrimonas soli]|uniref:Uncharacterized protein n=1 Tax=Oleiagrimonas soli TaxID=1543381 RepID=A0A841KFU4_9GAMM|nr:hypothetical protein [Oleiagrimonas soli]
MSYAHRNLTLKPKLACTQGEDGHVFGKDATQALLRVMHGWVDDTEREAAPSESLGCEK